MDLISSKITSSRKHAVLGLYRGNISNSYTKNISNLQTPAHLFCKKNVSLLALKYLLWGFFKRERRALLIFPMELRPASDQRWKLLLTHDNKPSFITVNQDQGFKCYHWEWAVLYLFSRLCGFYCSISFGNVLLLCVNVILLIIFWLIISHWSELQDFVRMVHVRFVSISFSFQISVLEK